MIRELYAIKDLCVGFGAPFIMVNEQVAKREFKNYLTTQKNPEDMQLFKIAEYNEDTGVIFNADTPEFIMGGEKIES